MLALIVSRYFYRLSPDNSAYCRQLLTGWSMQKKGELVVVHIYRKVVKFWFWQNRLYVRTPFHVSRGKILHFKQPRLFAVNRMATRTFREKNNNKVESFFRQDFNVFIDVDNGERGRARDNKQRRIISSEENMKKLKQRWEMPKIHDQDENERQWNKKANRNTCEIFFRKRSTRKFQVQDNDKGNVQKSQCCTRKHDFAN